MLVRMWDTQTRFQGCLASESVCTMVSLTLVDLLILSSLSLPHKNLRRKDRIVTQRLLTGCINRSPTERSNFLKSTFLRTLVSLFCLPPEHQNLLWEISNKCPGSAVINLAELLKLGGWQLGQS